MVWRRSNPAAAQKSGAVASSDDELDAALDSLGIILRALGATAVDTDAKPAAQTSAEYERWTQAITIGDAEGSQDGAAARRDWGGLRRFVQQQRKAEHEFVVRSLGQLRAAVYEFARALSGGIGEDRGSDEKLGEKLTRLDEALAKNDVGAVRGHAREMSELVRATIEQRRSRQRKQLEQLAQHVKALRKELDDARREASLDPLTRLYNRSALDVHLAQLAELQLLTGSTPALLMVDIDHFKRVNDQYGHQSGDKALCAIADDLVRHFVRREDFVARYGGEEFSVVVPDSSLQGVKQRAEAARLAISRRQLEIGGARLSLTVSIGLAAMRENESCASWIARADRALYEAKRQGRNRLVCDD